LTRRQRLSRVALAAAIALAASGCSMSMQLEDFFAKNDDETEASEMTGSFAAKTKPEAEISSADWNLAAAALREALGQPEDGASIPWSNPSTGSRGTVTPVAAAYVQDGFACRNFLASHVAERESWFEGTACRIHRGDWEIRSRRPLQKS
jgi:surface antigen